MNGVEKSEAKRRFIARHTVLYGGFSSLLAIGFLYHRQFGWGLGFSTEFGIRAVALLLFWFVVWLLVASFWWSKMLTFAGKNR